MRSIAFIASVSAVVLVQLARADDLIYQLPKDGTSATFEMDASVAGAAEHFKGAFTISSVGVATVEDQKCRWIELKLVDETQEARPRKMFIVKMLIPEEHLGKGKSPVDHVVRAWGAGIGDRGVREFSGLEFKQHYHEWFESLPLFMGRAAKDANELEPLEVDTMFGILPCAGVRGVYEKRIRDPNARVTFETRLNEKAPFGVVASVVRIESRAKPPVTYKLTLTETSVTAMSDVPDKK